MYVHVFHREMLVSSQQELSQVDNDDDQWSDFEKSAFKVLSSEDDEV